MTAVRRWLEPLTMSFKSTGCTGKFKFIVRKSVPRLHALFALLTKKLLGQDTDFQLPTVIWQDNTAPQTWLSLDNFGGQENFETFSLGQEEKVIQNQYPDKDFERYGKTYQTFNTELYQGKANQITIDLPVTKDLHLNGRAQLNLVSNPAQTRGSYLPNYWNMVKRNTYNLIQLF